MAAIAVVGVPCSGHDCFPPRNSVASNNATVFIGGVPVHIAGDPWPIHSCEDEFHAGVIISGSSRTFINGRPVARIGDGIGGVDCVSIISGANPTVYTGG
jgi:uncharacterized Zn-binding protein involved in type VI secretion